MKSDKGEARVGDLIPRDHRCEMKRFVLLRGRDRIASGVVFTDGRVAVVHRSGKEEVFGSVDELTRDYCGMCGLLWCRGERGEETPRLFVFHRQVDSTGVSGEGVAMEGAVFPDGRVVLTWLGPYRSLVHWPSIDQAVTVHGHGGDTTLRWVEEMERFAA